MLCWGVKYTTNQILNFNSESANSDSNQMADSDINNNTTQGLFSNENQSRSAVSPVASNFYSSVRTRSLIDSPVRYNKFPKLENVPHQLEMDYSRILNKPYFISNIPWSSVSTGELAVLNIPGDILNNPLAKIPFSASVMYRARLNVVLQVAGTPMHQGCVIASSHPYEAISLDPFDLNDKNSRMASPHAFLYANESTSVNVEVPFYVNTKLQPVDLDGNTVMPSTDTANYAQVRLLVLNQLAAPETAAASVTITAHFMFTDLEFYVPHVDVTWVPFESESFSSSITSAIDGVFTVGKKFTSDLLDNTRGTIRKWTGLHSPEHNDLNSKDAIVFRQNINNVDAPNFYEKLDPYSNFETICTDFVFDTDIDEMHMKEILKKPQFLGKFVVSTSDNSGTLLWSRPITPFQEVKSLQYLDIAGEPQFTNVSSNLLQTFHMLSRYWRGGMKVYIQAVMSNFHFCKLTIARNYSPSYQAIGNIPSFSDVSNLMMETLEFSAGGQIQEVKLPFCATLNQLPCSTDFIANAMQHGEYYIYLHQPLVTNGSVSTSVEFNVYVAADDDFDFFGYAVNPMLKFSTQLSAPALSKSVDLIDFSAESAVTPIPTSTQEHLELEKNQTDNEALYDLRPIKSVRDYMRRFYKIQSRRISTGVDKTGYGFITLPLAELLGNIPSVSSSGMASISTLALLRKMFYGYRGGMKFKIILDGTTFGEVYYVPPSFSVNATTKAWDSNQPVTLPGDPAEQRILEMYSFPGKQFDLSTFDPRYSIQTVEMERPNYINVNPSYLMSNTGTNATEVAAVCCEFEFRIPYMSPFRFSGSSALNRHVTNFFPTTIAPGDLGNIVIKYAMPRRLDEGVASFVQAINIEVFAAIDDVGRLGYQVNAPTVALGAQGVGDLLNKRYYQLIPSVQITGISSAPPLSIVKSNPGSLATYNYTSLYYTKSTI